MSTSCQQEPSDPNVRLDLGGWISGPCLDAPLPPPGATIRTCRYCGVELQLAHDGTWHAVPYADLSGYCPDNINDDRHQPRV